MRMTQEEIDALFSKTDTCTLCDSRDLPHPDEVQYIIYERVIIGHPGMHRGY